MSSSAAPYNITIDRGSDWSKVLTLSDNSGDPVAITNIFTVAISITGTTSPSVAAASLTYVSADLWTSNGNATAPGSGTWIRVRRSGGAWEITHWVAGVQSTGYWTSSSNPNHPAWVETWTAAAGATGSPVVDSAGMFFEGSVSLQERGPDVIPFSFDTVGDGSAGQVEISLSRSYTRALANSGAYRFDWFVYHGRERIRLVAGRISAQGSSTGTSTGIPVPAFGSSPSVAWGNITGTLSNQTDLQAALDAISGNGGASAWDDLTGTASDVPFLPVAAPAHSEGLLFYDSTDKSLTYYNDEADVSMNIGRELWVRVRNDSGSPILNGKVVYINDAVGQLPTIRLARADSATTSRVIGIATHDIGNNEFGYVTTTGEVKGLATNAYGDGDLLFLSAVTAGELTLTAPLAPNRVIQVATVLHAHPTQGKLYCHPETDSVPSTGIVDSTATGRALITTASAASARTTLELAAAATASTANTLVLRDGTGGTSFAGTVVMDVADIADLQFQDFQAAVGATFTYGAGGASAHRTALGSGATGDELFTAANSGAARTTLGLATTDSPTFAATTVTGAMSMSSFTGPGGLVEMKSGTTWQNLRLYSTTDNASNFEYITITQSGTVWRIGNNKSGTGANRGISLVAQGAVQLGASGGDGWTLTSAKHLLPDGTTNTRDLGQTTSRIRNLYVGTLIDCAGNINAIGTVQTGGYTFATLPTPVTGMRAYITNGAPSPVYMANAAGGGSTVTPVFYNGTNWVNA